MSAGPNLTAQYKQLTDNDHGTTLAAQVRAICTEVSWSRARELCRTGRVRIDDEPVFDPTRRMAAGTCVSVDEHAPRRACPVLEKERIVFNDGGLVVADKPSGLVVASDDRSQPDSLSSRLHLALLAQRRRSDPPHPLYYIDPEITGCVAYATDRPARRSLEQQFRARSPMRRFFVLVWGHPDPGKIDVPIVAGDDEKRHLWRGDGRPPKHARSAVTYVRIEQRFQDATLLVCEVENLRRHQLRVHLASKGSPVVGDQLYGRSVALEPTQQAIATKLNRPLVHAGFLGLQHPRHGRLVHITCDLPGDFLGVLAQLRRAG